MEFIKSPNFTDTGSKGRKVDLVVLHTMESAETPTTAENVARFFAQPATKASAHFCVDNNSVVQCVNMDDTAWAAPGCNHNGIQIEMAGRARQTAADWADSYSKALLVLAAETATRAIVRYDIPITFLRAPDLRAGRRGVTTHNEASKAFRLSDHTDPGPAFPMQQFLLNVLRFTKDKPTAPKVKQPPPTLKKGDTGWRVKQAQKLLQAANQKLDPDGEFGGWTEAAVKAFQKRSGLIADGVIGRSTWKALWQHWYITEEQWKGVK